MPSADNVREMAREGMDKMSNAAKELTEALGSGIGSLFANKKREVEQRQEAPRQPAQ